MNEWMNAWLVKLETLPFIYTVMQLVKADTAKRNEIEIAQILRHWNQLANM